MEKENRLDSRDPPAPSFNPVVSYLYSGRQTNKCTQGLAFGADKVGSQPLVLYHIHTSLLLKMRQSTNARLRRRLKPTLHVFLQTDADQGGTGAPGGTQGTTGGSRVQNRLGGSIGTRIELA